MVVRKFTRGDKPDFGAMRYCRLYCTKPASSTGSHHLNTSIGLFTVTIFLANLLFAHSIQLLTVLVARFGL